MATSIALTASFGIILAKHICKVLLKNTSFEDLLPDMLGAVIERSIDDKEHREVTKTLDSIADVVAKKMHTLMRNEFARIDEGEWQSAVELAARTMAEAEVSNKKLIELDMDSNKYEIYLLSLNANGIKNAVLSEDGTALYLRFIKEIARDISSILPVLPDFPTTFSKSVLHDQNATLELIQDLITRDDKESSSFEQDYRRVMKDNLDKLDLLGVRVVDEHHKRQRLSIAYIPLSVSPKQISKTSAFLKAFNRLQNGTTTEELQKKTITPLDPSKEIARYTLT